MIFTKKSLKLKPIHNYCGASLLEMMISFFVMGVGMMGVLGMQTQAMRFNDHANAYSQAMVLAQDIIESIRANKVSVAHYQIALDETAISNKDCGQVNSNCNQIELKDWDLKNWRDKIAKRLPGGTSAIDFDGKKISVIIEYDLTPAGGKATELSSTERETYVLTAGL